MFTATIQIEKEKVLLTCNCGGIYLVIKIHDEKHITNDRLCDVKCSNCENIRYFQPYDSGQRLNLAKGNKK